MNSFNLFCLAWSLAVWIWIVVQAVKDESTPLSISLGGLLITLVMWFLGVGSVITIP